MSGNRKPDDVDVQGAVIEDEYPLLYSLLDELVDAYFHLTGHRVTHDTREPRCYVSNFKLDFSDNYRVLRYSCFPMMAPSFTYGHKSFIMPIAELDGKDIFVTQPADQILESKFCNRRWDNPLAAKSLAQTNGIVIVDGKELYTTFKPTPMINRPRVELYCPFYKTNQTQDTIAKSIEILDDLWKQVVKTGAVDFPHAIFGDLSIKYQGKITNHLKISTQCRLEAKFIGRYGSAWLRIGIIDEMVDNINDVHVRDVLQQEMDKLLRKENHVTKKMVIDAYRAFKSGHLCEFQGLTGKYSDYIAERISSHPGCRPSLENCPGTFVEELEHTGGLLEPCDARREYPRLGDMCYLSITEQNCQLYFLKMVWERFALFDMLRARSVNSVVFENAWHEQEKLMADAQARWDVKFRRSLFRKAITAVEECLSPKKRKRSDELEFPRKKSAPA